MNAPMMMPATLRTFQPISSEHVERTLPTQVAGVGGDGDVLRCSCRHDPNDGCLGPDLSGRRPRHPIGLLRVALLHGERALDAGEVLDDEAAQRGGRVRVAPRARPGSRRAARAFASAAGYRPTIRYWAIW